MQKIFGHIPHVSTLPEDPLNRINPMIMNDTINILRLLPSKLLNSTTQTYFFKSKSYLSWFVGWNPITYKYRHEPEKMKLLCRMDRVDLAIFVAADPSKFQRRQAIRQSYGSLKEYQGMRISVFFILGSRENDDNLQIKIDKESLQYGDILQGSFGDSYTTILAKQLHGYRWVAQYCSGSRFTMKTYDDIFVNLVLIHKFLSEIFPTLPKNTMACSDIAMDLSPLGYFRPHRNGKYKISNADYPFYYYPPRFCRGTVVVTATRTAVQLSILSQVIKPFWVEDVWITGILPLYLGINHYKLHTMVLQTCAEVARRDQLGSFHAVRSAAHDQGKCSHIDAPVLYHASSWRTVKSIAGLA